MAKSRSKSVIIVMIVTLLSKCLGFLRDVVLANYFGAGSVTDAYFVAQTIPEFLFSIVVQAISIGFIPIYVDILHQKTKEDADRFTDSVTKISVILSCLLVLLVNLFPRQLVSVFATGFDESTTVIAVSFVRITVFAMLFRIVVAVFNAYLHANDHFVASAFNGIVLDVVMIASIVVAFYLNNVILALGIIIAAALQLLLLLPFVFKMKSGFSFSVKGMFGEDIKKMLKIVLPVTVGIAANQINVLADRTIASSIEGAISTLNYAYKVDNVLENVIILSLAAVMFPLFSKYAAVDQRESLKNSIVKSLNVATLTMLPCMFFCFAFSDEIIRFLFGRGAFDTVAIENASVAMFYYSFGVLFVSYNAILTRAMYALKKAKIVSVVTCCMVAANIGLNFLLKPVMGIGGLALATSISNLVGSAVLFLSLRKQLGGRLFVRTLGETMKCILSCMVLFFSSLGIYRLFSPRMDYLIALLIAGIVGAILYFVLELLLKSELIIEAFRRYNPKKLFMKKEL